jgi:uncharacterized membrane protein
MAWLGKSLVVLACMGYPWLAHSAIMAQQNAPVRLALAFAPLLMLAYWAVTRPRNRPLWYAVLLIAGVVIFLAEQEQRLGQAALGIPHAAINMFLLWFFGRTLLRGKEPLVTRFARIVHGTLTPQIEIYTRRVTIAWCVFFVAELMASVLLFRFASASTWSLFINFLNLPLVALMFVAEYGYRVIRLPDHPHVSILTAIQVFSKDFAASKSS